MFRISSGDRSEFKMVTLLIITIHSSSYGYLTHFPSNLNLRHFGMFLRNTVVVLRPGGSGSARSFSSGRAGGRGGAHAALLRGVHQPQRAPEANGSPTEQR